MRYYYQRFPKHLAFAVVLSIGFFMALKESWIAAQLGAVPFYGVLLLLATGAVVWSSSLLTDRYERQKHLRGTTLVANKAFSEAINGDGIAIPNNGPDKAKDLNHLAIKKQDESKHVLICGDTGSGKSSIFHYMAKQIRLRPDERAIFYDPKLEFYKFHGRRKSGDIVLYPFSEACPYWDIAEEITRPEVAKLIAKSLLPCKPGEEDNFFVAASRQILELLLLELHDRSGVVGELLDWLTDNDELDRIVEGHPVSQAIPKDAPDQRSGVLGSLSRVGDELKYLPRTPQGREIFSFARWSETRPGWIFVGASGVADQQILQPIFSIWFNILIQQLLDVPPDEQARPTWIFIDEIASLKTLGFLEQAMSQARSYETKLVLGFQNKYQIENFYNKLAAPILSAPKTKIFLRTTEADSAKWCAEMIGKPEFEQRIVSESSQLVGRPGESLSYRQDRKTDYLVLPSEFMSLPDRAGFLQYQGITTPIQFEYPLLQARNNISSIKRLRKKPRSLRDVSRPCARQLALLAEGE